MRDSCAQSHLPVAALIISALTAGAGKRCEKDTLLLGAGMLCQVVRRRREVGAAAG